MKIQIPALLAILSAVLLPTLSAQTKFTAWDVQDVAKGNHDCGDYGIRNDFQVLAPTTIWSLGACHGDS